MPACRARCRPPPGASCSKPDRACQVCGTPSRRPSARLWSGATPWTACSPNRRRRPPVSGPCVSASPSARRTRASRSSTMSQCRFRRSPLSWRLPTGRSPRVRPAPSRTCSGTWATATCTTTCWSGRSMTAPRSTASSTTWVDRFAGSISAEHGIGQYRVDELARRRRPEEMALAQRLKRALDPDGLLNPGKVLRV
jgi:hypothetical protein